MMHFVSIFFFLLNNNPKSNHLLLNKTPPSLLTYALMEIDAGPPLVKSNN